MTDVLPLDKYPHIQFGETVTSSVSQKTVTADMSQKTVTTAVSQKTVTRSGSHKCLMCPRQIKGRAKTCSDACRQTAARRKTKIDNARYLIISNLKSLQEYADQWPDLWPEIMDAVNKACVQSSIASRYVAPKGDSFPIR